MKRFANLGLAALLVAVFLLTACQSPPVQVPQPLQVEVTNADAFAPLAGNFGEVDTRSVSRGGLLCSTEGGACVESWNGSDLLMYSDTGSTLTFSVDGATGAVTVESTLLALSDPLTITGVLTDVQILYYQVP